MNYNARYINKPTYVINNYFRPVRILNEHFLGKSPTKQKSSYVSFLKI